MINRCAIMLVPQKLYFDWLKSNRSGREYDPEEYKPTIYLVSADIADEGQGEWEADGFKSIFRKELADWHADESTWPELTVENFKEWFLMTRIDYIEDMVEGELLFDDKNSVGTGPSGGRN